jgi:hypothetical protein
MPYGLPMPRISAMAPRTDSAAIDGARLAKLPELAEGHRYIAPNATLLLHDVSSAPVGGKADDQQVSATETARLNLLLWQRMARNIGKARDDLLAAHKARGAADWFVTAPEAVRLGLASQVGLPVFEWRQRLDPLLVIGAGE